MDLSSRLIREAEAVKQQIAADGGKAADIGSVFTTPGLISGGLPPDRKASDLLKASSGWVYACAGVIADELATIKIRLYQKSGKDDVKEVLDHPALDILHRANDFTTKFDLFWLSAQYLELTGEAPWFLSKDGKGDPTQVVLLRPDCLSVKPGKTGEIIGGYEYRVGSKAISLDLDEVVFLRYPDPDRQFRGRSPLQAAATTVDLEQYAEEYNRRFFFNSARPDGVLSTEQKLGDQQLAKLEKKLGQKYKGVTNAHKTIILEKGLKWEPMALSQKDMEFLEQSKFGRDKILGIFRVPKTVLGLTEEVNRATAEAADFVFAKRTIKPKMERIIQQLNEFLLPKFKGTENMFYDFDNPVPEDATLNLEYQKAALQFGWLTINEVRALDGYDPIDGGDDLRVPIGNAPMDEAGIPPELRAMRGKDFGNRLNVLRAKNRLPEKKAKYLKAVEHKLIASIKEVLLKGKKWKLKTKEVEESANPPIANEDKALEFQGKQLNIADEFEKSYINAVNRVFNAERKEIKARFGKSAKAKKDLDWRTFMLLPAKEKERFAGELSKLVTTLIIQQSAEAFSFIGLDDQFDAKNPALNAYLSKRAFKFARPVTQLTNRLLGRELKEGINAGEGIPQLQKRVDKVFDGIESYRSERIARSETLRATNYATEKAWKESGFVEAKQWLTVLDERTCEWCGPMNGRVIGLDDEWFRKGDVFAGNQGGALKLNYEDIERPPLHVNCRCTLAPIVVKAAPHSHDNLEAVEKEIQDILQNEQKDTKRPEQD